MALKTRVFAKYPLFIRLKRKIRQKKQISLDTGPIPLYYIGLT
jgi:hypothetical protein